MHLVLCDNAANMTKAMRDASLTSLGCFAHTLQLVVHDGVLSQRVVMDTLAVCRKIVGHFKHSSTAYSSLNTIQQNLGLPQYRLQQDVTCSLRYRIFYPPTDSKPAIVGKVITALSPIEEITKAVSANAASVSLIIHFV